MLAVVEARLLLAPHPVLCRGHAGRLSPVGWRSAGRWGQAESPVYAGAAAITQDLLCAKHRGAHASLRLIPRGSG